MTSEKTKLTKEEVKKYFSIYKDENLSKEERDDALIILYNSVNTYFIDILRKCFPTYFERYNADLISVCTVCFFEKIPDYNPEKAMLTTYFKVHIIHAVQEYINMGNNHTSYYGQQIKKIKKAIKELEDKGESWDIVILHEKTGLPISTLTECLKQSDLTEIHVSSSAFLEENIVQSHESPEEKMIAEMESASIHRALKNLSEEERNIIRLSFGIGYEHSFSNPKISELLHIDTSQVKRIKNNAMRKLTRSIEREGLFDNRFIKREIDNIGSDITFYPESKKESLAQFNKDIEEYTEMITF